MSKNNRNTATRALKASGLRSRANPEVRAEPRTERVAVIARNQEVQADGVHRLGVAVDLIEADGVHKLGVAVDLIEADGVHRLGVAVGLIEADGVHRLGVAVGLIEADEVHRLGEANVESAQTQRKVSALANQAKPLATVTAENKPLPRSARLSHLAR